MFMLVHVQLFLCFVFFFNLMRFFALLATYVLISRITFAHIGAYVRDSIQISGVQ